MSSDTVTIDGIEFDADNLEAAIEEIEDENGYTDDRAAVVGNVVAVGDGWASDDDTYFTLVEHADLVREGHLDADPRTSRRGTSSVRERIEEVRKEDFIEILTEAAEEANAYRLQEVVDTRENERAGFDGIVVMRASMNGGIEDVIEDERFDLAYVNTPPAASGTWGYDSEPSDRDVLFFFNDDRDE